MEQKEEENRNIQGTRTKYKSTTPFPHDLTLEILSWLPAKSVVRFRCVSKLWASITTDPYFIKSFKTRSSTRPRILVGFQEGDKKFFSSIPQDYHSLNESYTPSKPINHYRMELPQCSYFSPTEFVQGLICFQESGNPIVWNPSIGQFLTLPKPEPKEGSWKNNMTVSLGYDQNNMTVFLGYDPVEGKHKVVCMPFNPSITRVLTLGSAENSWRTVKTNLKFESFCGPYGRCINGVIYYKAYINKLPVIMSSDNKLPVIMSFDVRSEKLDMIKLPSHTNIHMDGLISYKGRLACVVEDDPEHDNGITLLILENAKKHKWLKMEDFLAPFIHYDPSSKIPSQLKGMTPNGEFVYVPNGFCESFYVVFYDPEKNSFRKVEFEGMVDNEFRLNNGVVNTRIYTLHTFVNHIESLSLMSL